MNSRCMRVAAVSIVLVLFTLPGFAQDGSTSRLKAASLDGTTGLFKTWDAENLRRGEANFTFGYDQFNRDPGELTVGRAVVGAAVGVMDRFEVFGSWEAYKRVDADGIRVNRPIGSSLYPSQNPAHQAYASQVAPFINYDEGRGRGDVRLGFRMGLMSERLGSPVSVAFTGFGTIPGHRDGEGLLEGLSSGAYQGGFAMLLSKTASDLVRFHVNVGTNMSADSKESNADYQHEFLYRFGAEFPVTRPYRVIAELDGRNYYGKETTPGWNPNQNPVDLIVGMRFYPRNWLALGGGYQASINHVTRNTALGVEPASPHGFVVQGAVGIRRNDPPTIGCAVAKNTILQDETTTVRVNATDPDNDRLTYSWTATGGKVTGSGDTATFDATGVAPGKYTVTATVRDKKHEVSCSSDITVLKRNVAPKATVEPASFSILPGESANLRCLATDENNDALTYGWTVNGQKLAAEGPQITFGSEGRNPGAYEVVCTASDGEASASAASKGTIREKPNQPPVIECQTTTLDVASGQSVQLSAKASDPDGDRLTYNWSGPGSAVRGRDNNATFNATGVRAGSYIVSVGVDDGRGGKASCSMTVNVSERISVTRDNCGFFSPRGTRVDNCAKAILDDLAVRMKNDPKLRANIIGYTDGSRYEKGRKGLGEARARAVADYLGTQGVEASRLTLTDGADNNPVGDNDTAAGRKLNRRVEIELSVR